MHSLYLYILQCNDNSYYTGVTNDIERRLREHQVGVNKECYTYCRRPVKVVLCEEFEDPNDAIEIEKQIKKWTHKKKQALIEGNSAKLKEYAACQNETHFSNFLLRRKNKNN